MRGQTLHNLIATRAQRAMEDSFEKVWAEHKCHRHGTTTFFDLLGQTGSVQLAIEIETTVRHAVANARKAAAVGVPVWFIVPQSRLQRALQRKFEMLDLTPGDEPIKILLLGQLQQVLTNYLSRRIDRWINNKKSHMRPIRPNPTEAGNHANQMEKCDRRPVDDHPDRASPEALAHAGNAREGSWGTVPFDRPSRHRHPAARDHLHHDPRDIHRVEQQTLIPARVRRSSPVTVCPTRFITNLSEGRWTEFCCQIRGP